MAGERRPGGGELAAEGILTGIRNARRQKPGGVTGVDLALGMSRHGQQQDPCAPMHRHYDDAIGRQPVMKAIAAQAGAIDRPSRAPCPAQGPAPHATAGEGETKPLSLGCTCNIRVLASYQRRRLEFQLSGNFISRLEIFGSFVTDKTDLFFSGNGNLFFQKPG